VCEEGQIRAERAVALAAYRFANGDGEDDLWDAFKASVDAWEDDYLDGGCR
jgi:hypothetical protein